ncbi:Wzz/FepE/Etk N-terminal domain-containing protein [Hydrogenimonas sp.]
MTSEKNFSENERRVMPPYGYFPSAVPEEEIDLRMLWQVVVRRKYTLLAVVVTALVAALLYLWTAKPVYEAKSLIQIGSIDSKPIEKPVTLKTKLETIYHVNDRHDETEYPFISAVAIPKKAEGLIQITAQGRDSRSAEALIEEVAGRIKGEHEELIRKYRQIKEKLLQIDREKTVRLKQEIAQLGTVLENSGNLPLKNRASASDYSLLSMEYTKRMEKLQTLQSLLSNTENAINRIELSLSPLNIKHTQMVGGVVTYDRPVKPKKKLVIAVAAVTGLMLGLFAIFLLEMFSTEKESAKG